MRRKSARLWNSYNWKPGTVTISVGVAECSKENYQETIKHADTALYRAKNMGRNRVVMYCSEMDSADNGYCG